MARILMQVKNIVLFAATIFMEARAPDRSSSNRLTVGSRGS